MTAARFAGRQFIVAAAQQVLAGAMLCRLSPLLLLRLMAVGSRVAVRGVVVPHRAIASLVAGTMLGRHSPAVVLVR